MSKQRRGFTIVELLIVIVVIGILAAITIVAFNGVTQRARVATISSDLEGAAKQLAIDQTLNSAYPATAAAANGGAGLKASPGTTYQYAVDNTASPQTFCITATNCTTSYYSSSTNNVPTVGACAGQGSGGVAAVTNLMPNPSAETGTTGFGASGGATISSVTDWAASGSRSFKVTTTTSTNQGDMRVASGGLGSLPLGLQAGHTYTLSAQVRIPVTITGGYDRAPGILWWYSTDGSTYIQAFGPKVPSAAGTYSTSYTFAVPSNAVGANIGFGVASSTSGQVVYYDSIMLTEGTVLYNYADGSSPNWIWNGTPNASTSTGPPQ